MLPSPKPLILGAEKMPHTMRWIYISPHFDDAVLSAGGLIWEQTHSGIPVEIWTICAGDPPGPDSEFARALHAQWNTGSGPETVALRRAEDKNAARRVGATVRHFDIPDAIYRRTQTGSLLYPQEIFIPAHPREKGHAEDIGALLAAQLTNHDTLVCPLALGGHVDHRITRAAVEALGRPLWYYADIPYALRYPEQIGPATYAMNTKLFYISPGGLGAWQDSIAAHASQINSLFVDDADMRQQIRENLRQQDGLRLWEVE